MGVKRFSEFINEATQEILNNNLTILFVGDIMQHQVQIDANEREYDYSEVFKDVKFLFEKADVIIGNLETTFAGDFGNDRKDGNVTFSAPDEFAKALADVGFTHICLANNHIMDNGVAGYQRTKDVLEKAGIKVIDKSTIIKAKDYEFEVYNFTTHINQDTPEDIKKEISHLYKTAATGVDFNIAFAHWGGQYTEVETKEQIEMAKELKDMGYEFVIGSGPHINHKTIVDNNKIVAYSLGDFLSDHRKEAAPEEGKILFLTINKAAQIIDLREYMTKSQTDKGKTAIRLLHINELV